ncbi:MAG: hypothetical protein FJY10_12510 [Bacteroidetes bacterium]|nr:hypothetical protein [Bacteroidota bacterium]
MEDSTSREKVLKKVRDALIYKPDNPEPQIDFESPVYHSPGEALDVAFAEALTNLGGKFIYCEDDQEFISSIRFLFDANSWDNLFCYEEKFQRLLEKAGVPFTSSPDDFTEMVAGVTGCESLIARLGTIVVSSLQGAGRRIFVYPPTHIVVAYASQLVPDIRQALQKIKKKYRSEMPSMISLISGPSRTADIEKTLVMGAHGPKELYVFLIDDSVTTDE